MADVAWWVLAGLAWLVVCWLVFVYVSVPLILVAAAVGLFVGTMLASVGYLRVYVGVEDDQNLRKPASNVPRRASAPYRYWDNGWPGYLTGQLERDVMSALAWPRRQTLTLWVKTQNWAAARALVLVVAWPLAPVPVVFLAAVTAGTYSAWLALAAASEAIVVIPRLIRWTAIAVLRAGDGSVRWWRGAAATCPRCLGVTRLPAYRCDPRHLGGIHRDLRAGRLGVWWRHCQCDARLPSTVLRAASTMTAICPACESMLHERAGTVPDARIALSGGPAVGKTQLLLLAMAGMTDGKEAVWEPADEDSAAWLHDTGESMSRRPWHEPRPTAEPVLLTLRDVKPHRERYVHFIDVGGQHFSITVRDPALRYLGTTPRHVLVLDPTTMPFIRDRIDPALLSRRHGDHEDSRIAESGTSSAAAEVPYHVLVAQLNRCGAQTRRCSLAVVITKADVLAKQDLGPESDLTRVSSRDLKAWLCAKGLRNLVDMAEHDFGSVRYFLVGVEIKAMDPVAPFAWLLDRHRRGVTIP
jgi:hypothetical protein